MPVFRIALLGAVALSLVTLPANACPSDKTVKLKSYAPADMGGETIRKVNRGERLAIMCEGVDLTGPADVRVVLNFASGANELGYKGVLATDQTRSEGKLQIRVPDAPDLANHTLDVEVFMLNGGDKAKTCDAGKVRIT
jgi:hypothetical protein